MLAKVTDYLAPWQLPVGMGLLGLWVLLGGLLLHRSVRGRLSRSKGSPGRCFLVALLAGGGAGTAAAIIAFMLNALGEHFEFRLALPAIVSFGVVFLLVAFCVLWASFDLSTSQTARLAVFAFGPPLLLVLLVAGPLAWHTYSSFQEDLRRKHSEVYLRAIYNTIRTNYRRLPPKDLQELVDHDLVPASYLRCRARTGRTIDYFYVPAPIVPGEPSQRVLACDFIENHNGAGRGVLFTNGTAQWYTMPEVRPIFERDENRGFAIALREAEKEFAKR